MKVYDYAFFFEDGTREGFYLKYGPEGGNDDRIFYHWEESEHLHRFNEEMGDNAAFKMFEYWCSTRPLAVIIVNPPRELEEDLGEWENEGGNGNTR